MSLLCTHSKGGRKREKYGYNHWQSRSVACFSFGIFSFGPLVFITVENEWSRAKAKAKKSCRQDKTELEYPFEYVSSCSRAEPSRATAVALPSCTSTTSTSTVLLKVQPNTSASTCFALLCFSFLFPIPYSLTDWRHPLVHSFTPIFYCNNLMEEAGSQCPTTLYAVRCTVMTWQWLTVINWHHQKRRTLWLHGVDADLSIDDAFTLSLARCLVGGRASGRWAGNDVFHHLQQWPWLCECSTVPVGNF